MALLQLEEERNEQLFLVFRDGFLAFGQQPCLADVGHALPVDVCGDQVGGGHKPVKDHGGGDLLEGIALFQHGDNVGEEGQHALAAAAFSAFDDVDKPSNIVLTDFFLSLKFAPFFKNALIAPFMSTSRIVVDLAAAGALCDDALSADDFPAAAFSAAAFSAAAFAAVAFSAVAFAAVACAVAFFGA
eukprot:CAMPEP_0176218210 /NCGR_PEP_ID=MMETSP0121_2-20121125/18087_1 /TAXON_ID=160619 /ORGANISM="Kryptoperidinium foliaceum, Strain CCMP 1326" /LENGTH=186 /DNA_ID=CAMNT_0017557357 /DNA_START=104 /DNA_END=662 /DNA_ORIENTATION=+